MEPTQNSDIPDAELVDRLFRAREEHFSRELAICKQELLSRLAARAEEVSRVRALINRDRTGLAAALVKVRDLVKGYWWLREEHGWASYEWQERTIETLRKEFGFALEAVDKVASEALSESGQLAFAAFHPELDRGSGER
jgi:hypothetical protein